MCPDPLVLAVDDDSATLRLIQRELGAQGFRVLTANTAERAIQLTEASRPDLILLDSLEPRITNIELMREIHELLDAPVVVVSSHHRDLDKVRALDLGADDYIVKPFNPEELAARVRAVLRRTFGRHREHHVLTAGDVEIDLTRRLIKRGGEAVVVTRTEWLLLQHLAVNAGKVMLNAELLTKVWGPEYCDDVQYLRVWVSRLRAKLGDTASAPKLIRTHTGIGYCFIGQWSAEPAEEGAANLPSAFQSLVDDPPGDRPPRRAASPTTDRRREFDVTGRQPLRTSALPVQISSVSIWAPRPETDDASVTPCLSC